MKIEPVQSPYPRQLNMKAAVAMRQVVLSNVDKLGMNGGGLEIGLAEALDLPEVRHHVLATLTDNEIEAALRNRTARGGPS